MAAEEFDRVVGDALRDILVADGWTVVWERMGHVYMQKDGRHRVFPLAAVLSQKMVRLVAECAGWDRKRFDALRAQVGGKPFSAGAVFMKPPSSVQ